LLTLMEIVKAERLLLRVAAPRFVNEIVSPRASNSLLLADSDGDREG